MDIINKWQSLYQKQESKPLNLDKLVGQLNRIEKNAKKRRYLLIIAFLVLTITALFELSTFENIFNIFTYIFVCTALFMKLNVLYKGKYNIINIEADFNNQNYISKLKEKKRIEKKHLFIFMALIILGLNCALIGIYNKGTIFKIELNESYRVYGHLSTIIISIFGYYINSKKIDKYKKNISELIKELEVQNQYFLKTNIKKHN